MNVAERLMATTCSGHRRRGFRCTCWTAWLNIGKALRWKRNGPDALAVASHGFSSECGIHSARMFQHAPCLQQVHALSTVLGLASLGVSRDQVIDQAGVPMA